MRGLLPVGWRRNVWALTLTVFISFVGFQFFSPFLPLYIRELGVTDPAKIALWAGLQAAVTPAMSGILSPLFGRLADRFGRKMMLIDRKSTRLNSSHGYISYAVFCLKKKKERIIQLGARRDDRCR